MDNRWNFGNSIIAIACAAQWNFIFSVKKSVFFDFGKSKIYRKNYKVGPVGPR